MDSIGVNTGEEVEEKKECALPAGSDCDVLRAHFPSALFRKHLGERLDECGVSLGRIVISDHSVKAGAVLLVEQVSHSLPEKVLHFGDLAGIASTHHAHLPVAPGHGSTQIVHEFEDA